MSDDNDMSLHVGGRRLPWKLVICLLGGGIVYGELRGQVLIHTAALAEIKSKLATVQEIRDDVVWIKARMGDERMAMK